MSQSQDQKRVVPSRNAPPQRVNFALSWLLGGLSGVVGASCVYPLDMIKTRLQNQKTVVGSNTRMYNGIIDCFQKIVQKEGVLGLYRGLPAQWVGIIPEKATKLAMNAYMRKQFMYYNGDGDYYGLSIIQEGIAGAVAGASHLIFTSPYELVKINLQIQGTREAHLKKSFRQVMQDVGFKGMFRGMDACLFRDVTFSILYFGMYGTLKGKYINESGYLSLGSQLFLGTISGVFASSIVTPFDTIKTRLQTYGGEERYTGMIDCGKKIVQKEGATALYKGVGPRVLIISPLFGITLLVYEQLVKFFEKKK